MMNERERAICSRVRSFRESIKWPQPDFAAELGISRDRLASIEYHRSPLRYSVAIAMCRAFDLSALWLATGNGQALGYGPVIWTHEERTRFCESDLLSRVYDFCPSCFRDRHTGGPIPFRATPGFDPKDFLIQEILIWFRAEKFRTPAEAEAFALEVHDFAKRVLRSYQHSGRAVRKWQSHSEISGPQQHKEKSKLTVDIPPTPATLSEMSSEEGHWKGLVCRLKPLTAAPGAKAQLARELDTTRQAVNKWLSGTGAPSAEVTLRLLSWVNQQEQKPNALGSTTNTAKGKATRRKVVYEKKPTSSHKQE
jgi:transcriptional regulator with XRE-family HTH domain